MIILVRPVIDHSVRAMCALPYPGHDQGCPHYGQRQICPPDAPLFDEFFDLSQPVFAIYISFDLASHVARLRDIHPDWTGEQVQDLWLWNAETKKALQEEIALFHQEYPHYTVVECPEAMGVNITETARQVGIELQWQQPISTIYRIALAGRRKLEGNPACPRIPHTSRA